MMAPFFPNSQHTFNRQDRFMERYCNTGYEDEDEDASFLPSGPFHLFMRLPPEIRHLIWQHFCPNLTAISRVLSFNIFNQVPLVHDCMETGMFMEEYTNPLRTMMAVHGESRELARKKYPDTLTNFARGHPTATMCYNAATDIFAIEEDLDGADYDDQVYLPASFTDHVRNVAIRSYRLWPDEAILWLQKSFNNLQRVFRIEDPAKIVNHERDWFPSPNNIELRVRLHEEVDWGFRNSFSIWWRYPNFIRHSTWAKLQMAQTYKRPDHVEFRRRVEDLGLELYPMVMGHAMRSRDWDALMDPSKTYQSWDLGSDIDDSSSENDDDDDDDDGDDDDDEEDEEDEYESEGIDDGEIEDVSLTSEDEDVPAPIDEGSSLNGGQPLDDNENFGHPGTSSSEENGTVSKDEAGPSTKSRKRRIVSDSESDDGEPAQASVGRSGKPAAKMRNRRVVASDDDEEEEEEEEDDNEGEEGEKSTDDGDTATRARTLSPRPNASIIDLSDDSDDSVKEVKSLAHKLSQKEKMKKKSNRVTVLDSSEDESSSNEEEEEEEVLDDEGEAEEDEDEEDEDEEDGLIITMAEESGADSNDEEGYSEGW